MHADHAALRYVALSPDAKDMAENMYRALWSWIVCVIVTVVVSLLTRPRPVAELAGLVYGASPIPKEPMIIGIKSPSSGLVIVFIVFLALNIIFW